MTKYIIAAVAVVVVLGGGWFAYEHLKGGSPSQNQSQPSAPAAAATTTYTGSSFSVVYPTTYTTDPTYTYTQVNPQKPISGVKFTIPGSMATGTNLSADTYVSVEQLPRAKNCTGDIYLAANVHAHTITDSNGTTYSVASSSDAGAGNEYEETVYAIAGSNPCTAIRYYVHTTNIDNYPAGTVQPFDQASLLSAFDTIRQSVVLTGAPAGATLAPTQ